LIVEDEAKNRDLMARASLIRVDARPDRLQEPPRVGSFLPSELVMTYANGDRTNFVIALYEGALIGGEPSPDAAEGIELRWFDLTDVAGLDLARCPRAVLDAAGLI
jgi:hypothetical protein